ncbi:MAG: sel1 repeat family protein, partial [Opitutales bacterium]|nr:sel1 repeat family protein [Opitutales bacterium]
MKKLLVFIAAASLCMPLFSGEPVATYRSTVSLRPEPLEDVKAKADAGDAYSMRHYAIRLLNRADIDAEGKKPAKAYMKKALDAGDVYARNCGVYIVDEFFLSEDVKNNLEKYNQAAKNGDKDAFYALGVHYIASDKSKALEFLQKSAEAGSARAMYLCASLFANKDEAFKNPIDTEKAVFWYKKAVEAGNAPACGELAYIYANNIWGMGDDAEALKYDEIGISRGDGRSELNRAFYLLGNKLHGSKAEALKLLYSAGMNYESMAWYNLGAIAENDGDNDLALDYFKRGALLGNKRCWQEYSNIIAIRGINEKIKEEIKANEKLSREGDIKATFWLAKRYRDGVGVPCDYKKALELFEKCAAADYAEAYAEIIILLAAEFENGENAKRCLQLYPKATAGRVDLARLLIGNLYYNGSLEGGEKKALEFYILASDKNAAAAANAAKMYARAQNFGECFKYLRKAATLGDTESMRVYAYACIVGDIKDFDPREVLGLVETLVENEIDGALYLLGLYHEAGVAGSADIDSAMKAYSAGAEKSDANCQFKMGWFLTTGDGGVKKNEESGVKYYKAAYAQNHIPAAMNLGGCYMQGIGVEKDEKKAFELWKQCAAFGDE